MKLTSRLLLAAAFGGCAASSFAQTVTWTGTTGVWGTPTNWSSGATPTASQSVLISDAGSSGSISLGANRTIGELTMTRSANVIIQMNPENLTISNADGNTGNLTTQAGSAILTFRNSGTLSVQGNLTVASNVQFGSRSSSGASAEIGGVNVSGTTFLGHVVDFSTVLGTANLGSLVMNTGGILNLTAGSGGNGTVAGATNTVTINRLNGTTGTIQANKAATTGVLVVATAANDTYAGTILNGSGTVQLNKSGNGSLTLSGSNTYTGATSVTAGTLVIAGSLGNTAVTVEGTGILAGSGTIGGAVSVNSGGQIAAGTSPGQLTIANSVSLTDGSAAAFELTGATEGTQYDQIRMTGAGSVFSLTGTNNLVLSLSFVPATDALFFLVDNQGSSAISGIFEQLNGVTTNLAQDAIFTVSGQQFRISYTGDVTTNSMTGGNDLVVQAVPEPAAWTLLAGGLTTLLILRRRTGRD